MTEREWSLCEQCDSLLSLLQSRGLATQRKLRLFGVACCLYSLDLFVDARLHDGLRTAERLADGSVTEREYAEVELAIFDVVGGELDEPLAHGGCGSDIVLALLDRQSYSADEAARCAYQLEYATEYNTFSSFEGLAAEMRYEYCLILRDIFGNPFRPVSFAPAWRTDTALALARQMYESRDFGAAPILADALQDAGCDSDELLNHLRDATAPHVRGCWAVDLVLGKV